MYIPLRDWWDVKRSEPDHTVQLLQWKLDHSERWDNHCSWALCFSLFFPTFVPFYSLLIFIQNSSWTLWVFWWGWTSFLCAYCTPGDSYDWHENEPGPIALFACQWERGASTSTTVSSMAEAALLVVWKIPSLSVSEARSNVYTGHAVLWKTVLLSGRSDKEYDEQC